MLGKLKIALVLLVIGSIAGGAIYAVNYITEPIIAENELKRKIEFYSEIFNVDKEVGVNFFDCTTKSEDVIIPEGTTIDDLHYELRSSCPAGITETYIYTKEGIFLGSVYSGSRTNSYGQVDVLVGVYSDDSIAMVVISSSTNTPNFVKKIEKNHLEAFSDFTVNDVEFDSFTGATFTYTSVTEIVNDAIEAYLEGSDQ